MNGLEMVQNQLEELERSGMDYGVPEPGDNLKAAQCYILFAQGQLRGTPGDPEAVPKMWPFAEILWAPDPHVAKNNIRKAAAFSVREWNFVDDLGL